MTRLVSTLQITINYWPCSRITSRTRQHIYSGMFFLDIAYGRVKFYGCNYGQKERKSEVNWQWKNAPRMRGYGWIDGLRYELRR